MDRSLETLAQMFLMGTVNPVRVKYYGYLKLQRCILLFSIPSRGHMLCTVIRVIPEELRRNTQ
jgi:hypothetical protein